MSSPPPQLLVASAESVEANVQQNKHTPGLLAPPFSAPIRNAPHRRKPMVCGYVFDEHWLYAYGREHGIPPFNALADQYSALLHVLDRAKLSWRGHVCGAITERNGQKDFLWCVAVAHIRHKGVEKLASEEAIKSLQEIFQTDEPPQWYLRF